MSEELKQGLSYPDDMNEAFSVLGSLPPEVATGVKLTLFTFICVGAI